MLEDRSKEHFSIESGTAVRNQILRSVDIYTFQRSLTMGSPERGTIGKDS